MAKIRERLDALAKALGLNKPLLQRARRRYRANRKRAFKAHNQQVVAQRDADQLRARGNVAGAARKDKLALRKGHVAYRNHLRAQVWLGRVKVLVRRVHGIAADQAAAEAALRKLAHVSIKGNKATGGNKHERLKAVALASAVACATGRRANFYSQAGAWDVDHCITGERYGERSDCSSWATSVYRSAGLSDPNGERYTGGYTGTLGAHGKQVSLSNARPGDLVLYGPFPHHHVELIVDPANQVTVGHGSSPVDKGVVDLFDDGDYTIRTY
jgi:hypothetical protein